MECQDPLLRILAVTGFGGRHAYAYLVKAGHPRRSEVAILQQHPITTLARLFYYRRRDRSLALAERNVMKAAREACRVSGNECGRVSRWSKCTRSASADGKKY